MAEVNDQREELQQDITEETAAEAPVSEGNTVITDSKLTPEEEIEFLGGKLRETELQLTEKNIALIEMTAARNALYRSLQETQMRLAEAQGQRENDVEAYQKELDIRLDEKRRLQEQVDALSIKAKRYDELQESIVKIKMKAELRAHGVIDEAQEKAMDTVMLIDNIEKEIKLFREDITYLRRDIKIGTVTLDDRLENVYLRLCRNLDRLVEIKEEFYKKNSLPLGEEEEAESKSAVPTINYPDTKRSIDADELYSPKEETSVEDAGAEKEAETDTDSSAAKDEQ